MAQLAFPFDVFLLI